MGKLWGINIAMPTEFYRRLKIEAVTRDLTIAQCAVQLIVERLIQMKGKA